MRTNFISDFRSGILALLALSSLYGCQLDDNAPFLSEPLELPAGFPPIPFPADNHPTPARIALGKQLFFDPILSRDSSISCGSCHFQEKAFADFTEVSVGIDRRKGLRNAPSLFNLAWHPYFFWDGGVPNLEQQVLAPIEAHVEMDNSLLNVLNKLNAHPYYPEKFRIAYARNPDPFSIVRAIAAFERTMVSGNSPYDHYINGIDSTAISAAEIRGMNLFFGEELKCGTCHSGFDFSDYTFQNIGLPETPGDSGRMRVTLLESDRNKFKTPSLRNVALTGPYMHDGSIGSLEEVIDFLASGGAGYPNQSPLTQGFTITNDEKQDLISFLNALTDQAFVTEPAFEK